METAEVRPFLSAPIPNHVTTGASVETSVTRDTVRDQFVRERWQRLIDTLIDWFCDPGQLEDEGIEPPTREILDTASLLLTRMRDAGHPPPDTVVPDPNGGVVFEHREGDSAKIFHIWDDGSVEYRRFEGTKLAERRRLI